ncbi:MAG: hypothetical protein ACXABY_06390 [Candidatus Thorarchaeota archaeon]|jgi:hypothetical protein
MRQRWLLISSCILIAVGLIGKSIGCTAEARSTWGESFEMRKLDEGAPGDVYLLRYTPAPNSGGRKATCIVVSHFRGIGIDCF